MLFSHEFICQFIDECCVLSFISSLIIKITGYFDCVEVHRLIKFYPRSIFLHHMLIFQEEFHTLFIKVFVFFLMFKCNFEDSKGYLQMQYKLSIIVLEIILNCFNRFRGPFRNCLINVGCQQIKSAKLATPCAFNTSAKCWRHLFRTNYFS